jgi:hypothetical protein
MWALLWRLCRSYQGLHKIRSRPKRFLVAHYRNIEKLWFHDLENIGLGLWHGKGHSHHRMEWPFGMGKARFELARISPRDPKSRSSAHSDTSPSPWKLYYERPFLASEGAVGVECQRVVRRLLSFVGCMLLRLTSPALCAGGRERHHSINTSSMAASTRLPLPPSAASISR